MPMAGSTATPPAAQDRCPAPELGEFASELDGLRVAWRRRAGLAAEPCPAGAPREPEGERGDA